MPIAEGSAIRYAYKFYSSGTIAQNAEANIATDPGASGGKILRRVSASLALRKNTRGSPEVLPSRQLRGFRHTTRWADGNIAGVLSPGTYGDFVEAAARGTSAAVLGSPITQATLTSLAADNTLSTLTVAAGDPVAAGLTIGAIINITGLTGAGIPNNNVRFVIVGFSGASNRTMQVFPAPTTHTALTTFSIATPGKSVIVPSSGHVKRRVAIERLDTDLARTRLFTEGRVTGFAMSIPPDDNATFTANITARNRRTLTGGSSPYFTSPAAATVTDLVNGLNGALFIGGTAQGVITGINLNFAMPVDAPYVVGQTFVPDILLGTANLSGDFTALVDDVDAITSAFENETEISLLVMLTAGTSTADAISIYIPRVKVSGADENAQGEGSQVISGQFQAMEYLGAAVGVTPTTFRYTDTAWT